MNEYTGAGCNGNYGASVSLDMRSKTMDNYGKQAQQDRRTLEEFISRKTLTGNERQNLERIKADVASGDGAALPGAKTWSAS